MNKLLNTIAVLALTTSVTACMGNTAVQGATKPGTVKSGLFHMNTADDVKVDTDKAFAGAKDVVIGQFVVGFTDSAAANNKASGGLLGSGVGGNSKALVKLEGISDATRQQITDAAYSDFVAKLKAKGYNVVDRSKLTGSETWKGVKLYDMPYEYDNSGMLSSYGVTHYFSPDSFGKQVAIFGGDIPEVTGGFALDNSGVKSGKFAKETGIKVLHVAYLVDFANAGGSAGITSSTITMGQGISVRAGSKIGIIGDEGGTFSTGIGTISAGQPVFSEKEFGTVESTTSEGAKAVEVAANIIGMMGGVGTNSEREYVVHANSAKFSSISGEVIKETNAKLTDKMASLK